MMGTTMLETTCITHSHATCTVCMIRLCSVHLCLVKVVLVSFNGLLKFHVTLVDLFIGLRRNCTTYCIAATLTHLFVVLMHLLMMSRTTLSMLLSVMLRHVLVVLVRAFRMA